MNIFGDSNIKCLYIVKIIFNVISKNYYINLTFQIVKVINFNNINLYVEDCGVVTFNRDADFSITITTIISLFTSL